MDIPNALVTFEPFQQDDDNNKNKYCLQDKKPTKLCLLCFLKLKIS